jgi:hypothetical protein
VVDIYRSFDDNGLEVIKGMMRRFWSFIITVIHVVRKVLVLHRDVLVGESWVRAGGYLGCGLLVGFCTHVLVAILAAVTLHSRLCSKPGILLCVLLIVSKEILVHVELIYGELEERGLTIARLAHDPLFEALEGKLRETLHHVLISRNEDTGLLHEKALHLGGQIVTGGLDFFVIAGVTESNSASRASG